MSKTPQQLKDIWEAEQKNWGGRGQTLIDGKTAAFNRYNKYLADIGPSGELPEGFDEEEYRRIIYVRSTLYARADKALQAKLDKPPIFGGGPGEGNTQVFDKDFSQLRAGAMGGVAIGEAVSSTPLAEATTDSGDIPMATEVDPTEGVMGRREGETVALGDSAPAPTSGKVFVPEVSPTGVDDYPDFADPVATPIEEGEGVRLPSDTPVATVGGGFEDGVYTDPEITLTDEEEDPLNPTSAPAPKEQAPASAPVGRVPPPPPPPPPSAPRNDNSGIVPQVNLPPGTPAFRDTITPTSNPNSFVEQDMGTRTGGPSLQSVLSQMDKGVTSKIASRRRNSSSISKLKEDIKSFHIIYDGIISSFKNEKKLEDIMKSKDKSKIIDYYEELESKISNYYKNDSGFKLGVIISAESLFNGSIFNQSTQDLSASGMLGAMGQTPIDNSSMERGGSTKFNNIKVITPTYTSGGVDAALGKPVQNHLVKTIPKKVRLNMKPNVLTPLEAKGSYQHLLNRPLKLTADWKIKTKKNK